MSTPATREENAAAPKPLAGRTALVTGGGVRIGAAIAEGLAVAGADVVVHYHGSKRGALEVSDRIQAVGRQAWTVEADFADPRGAAQIVDQAREAGAAPDLLVNNASIYPFETLQDTSLADLERTLAINAWAPLEIMRAFAGRARPGAAIVNILDTHVHGLTREKFAYQLSKQALAWLTRYGALTFAPDVRVNAVAPGAILPPPNEGEAYLDRLGSRLPLKRHGRPQDVVEAAIFLANAPFVTGVTLDVDGGEHLEGPERA